MPFFFEKEDADIPWRIDVRDVSVFMRKEGYLTMEEALPHYFKYWFTVENNTMTPNYWLGHSYELD